MPHLFDRFWRGDGARTTGQNSGLGLALVQAFAELLSQKVEAALKGENLEISLFFPDNASA
jgi:signal transduction histidine kinase